MGDLVVQGGKLRPMQAGLVVVRGVIAEISRQEVVPAVKDVVGRNEMRRRLLACVMAIGMPRGVKQHQHHRKDEDDQRRDRAQDEERPDDRECEHGHGDENAPLRLPAPRDLPHARIGRHSHAERVLQFAHPRAVLAAPPRLVLGLIEIVEVMTERVMQHPSLARDPRL